MKMKRLTALHKWLIVPPVIVGVIVLVVMVTSRGGPVRRAIPERARSLRVIKVPQLAVVPRVLGYGTARPADVWRGLAEIKGRLLSVHADLSDGAVFKKGVELLRIDVAEYELVVTQLMATMQQVRGQIEELAAQEQNNKDLLAIEQQSLRLAEEALQRSRDLLKAGRSSQAEVDGDQRTMLLQKKSVQMVANALRLIPAQIKTLRASLEVQASNLAEARLDVAKAAIVAPFDCRIAGARVEKGQFVGVGEVLFEAQSLAATEIEAKMDMGQLRIVLDPESHTALASGMAMAAMREVFAVDVAVRAHLGERRIAWKGRFDRVRELVDEKTRAIGIVVAVDRPYSQVVPGERPPLVKGMYCSVELRARSSRLRLVIPRSALHGDTVFILDADNRLCRRRVVLDYVQSDFACVLSGLQQGDVLVVSDPTPAIAADPERGQKGMLVTPVDDPELAARIRAEALAEVELR